MTLLLHLLEICRPEAYSGVDFNSCEVFLSVRTADEGRLSGTAGDTYSTRGNILGKSRNNTFKRQTTSSYGNCLCKAFSECAIIATKYADQREMYSYPTTTDVFGLI